MAHDDSVGIPYTEPDIRLCAQNTTKISDLFKFLESSNKNYMREVEHTREVLSKDIQANREIMSKDLQNLCDRFGAELSGLKGAQGEMQTELTKQGNSIASLDKTVMRHYRIVSGWALWFLGSIAVSSVLLALNLLTAAR